jgi:hypothetical protein
VRHANGLPLQIKQEQQRIQYTRERMFTVRLYRATSATAGIYRSEGIIMRIFTAFFLSILTTSAMADGVGYMQEPHINGSTFRVLLSDVVMEPSDCSFDGDHGYLGRIQIDDWKGARLSEHTGCWRYVEHRISFCAEVNGEWRYWTFPIEQFKSL